MTLFRGYSKVRSFICTLLYRTRFQHSIFLQHIDFLPNTYKNQQYENKRLAKILLLIK